MPSVIPPELHKSGRFTCFEIANKTVLKYFKTPMTAINIATDIPSQINTLEKLAAWANLALASVNPTLQATEGVGYTERAAQAGIFFVLVDNKYRFLGRTSIEISPDHLAGGSKTWNYAIELSNTPLPALFKSN